MANSCFRNWILGLGISSFSNKKAGSVPPKRDYNGPGSAATRKLKRQHINRVHVQHSMMNAPILASRVYTYAPQAKPSVLLFLLQAASATAHVWLTPPEPQY